MPKTLEEKIIDWAQDYEYQFEKGPHTLLELRAAEIFKEVLRQLM